MTDGGGIFVALTSCRDEERVEEFLTWYAEVQFRNALTVDSIDAATLYRSTEPGELGFLAIYSLTGDVADTAAQIRAAIEDRHAAGNLTELSGGSLRPSVQSRETDDIITIWVTRFRRCRRYLGEKRGAAPVLQHGGQTAGNIGQLRIEAVESGRQVIHRPAHLQSQRDQTLLGTVVQVTLDAAASVVGGSHDPCP